MSCVCILTPVLVAAWPAFSSAVVAAAASLGYSVVRETTASLREEAAALARPDRVDLALPNSEIITDRLGRDQQITVRRGTLTITFRRDARGKGSLCVQAPDLTEAEMRAQGEELGRRVIQQQVYQRLVDECRARQYVVVEEAREANQSIRLRIRHYEA
jgi:hypothetical protein